MEPKDDARAIALMALGGVFALANELARMGAIKGPELARIGAFMNKHLETATSDARLRELLRAELSQLVEGLANEIDRQPG
jgi:hypothetical protein